MIELIADLISLFLAAWICMKVISYLMKRRYKKLKDKQGIKELEKFELKVKGVISFIFGGFWMIMQMIICAILAIGTIPIIYKFNESFGEGYARFASYLIAICLWILLHNDKK